MKIKHLLRILVASAFCPLVSQADEIQLTLSADAVGSTKELALNADLTATLQWGDGTTQTLRATGLPQSVEIKHTSLSIKTQGTNDLTQLFAPNFGVTRVNFVATKGLEVLDLSDNQFASPITSLTTTYLPALREVYMRNSQIQGRMMLNSMTQLEVVDLSNNQITGFIAPSSAAAKLRSLVLSGNQLATVSLGSSQYATTVWVNDNQLKAAPTGSLTKLSHLVASGNEITTLALAPNVPLQQLWVDENKLTTLDLSTTTGMVTLSAEDNELTEIKYPAVNQRTKLVNFYVRGNALAPTNIINYALSSGRPLSTYSVLVDEQKPIPLAVEQVDPNVALDVKQFFTNVNNTSISPTFTVISSTGDVVDASKYTVNTSAKTLTFNEAVGAVHLSVTGVRTPGATFKSSWVDVGPVTAINSASKDKASLDVAVTAGGIVLSVASPVAVKIYSVSGAMVYDAVVDAAKTVSVPAGVYVVNGNKVLVP